MSEESFFDAWRKFLQDIEAILEQVDKCYEKTGPDAKKLVASVFSQLESSCFSFCEEAIPNFTREGRALCLFKVDELLCQVQSRIRLKLSVVPMRRPLSSLNIQASEATMKSERITKDRIKQVAERYEDILHEMDELERTVTTSPWYNSEV